MELWARWIGQWCGVVGVRVRQSSTMGTTVLGFAAAGVRVSETERERVRGASEGRDARMPLQHMPAHDAS